MRRRLFTFASAVSALLCVATCVLWVHFRQDDEPRLGFKWGRFGYDRSQTTDLAAGFTEPALDTMIATANRTVATAARASRIRGAPERRTASRPRYAAATTSVSAPRFDDTTGTP